MYSRPLARLAVGTLARRSFSSGTRNAGQRQRQQQQQQGQTQWSRSKLQFGRLTSGVGAGVASVALSGGIIFVLHASTSPSDEKLATPSKVDYNEVRKSIAALLDDENYDDGSYGPLFVRLGWHASGTYSHIDSSGGSNGGCMRFEPESGWGANKGLKVARERLQGVYRSHPGLTFADLYTLAAVVAIEEMGGPVIKWRPGRNDHEDGKKSPGDGRLPDAAQGASHVREIFYRMGFNDEEIVALSGAHSMGRCHTDRSGYDGPWSNAPTTFSNEYFRLLLEEKWQIRRWKGPKQYEDVKTKTLMMLPSDIALVEDPEFRKYVVQYAKDGEKFANDFAKAYGRLLELGVEFRTTDGSVTGKNSSLWSRIFG